jgi:hypothetical protein
MTILHTSSKLENYIMVVVKFIFQHFQNLRLLFPNPCGRFVGIILLLASERCVLVGWLLAVSFCCGRSHGVAWGRKI